MSVSWAEQRGIWVPIVGGTATYATQTGTWTKIGRMVFFTCDLAISAIGTGSTSTISGLPFASSAVNGPGAAVVQEFSNLALAVASIFGSVPAGGAAVQLRSVLAAGGAAAALNAVLTNSTIRMCGQYIV